MAPQQATNIERKSAQLDAELPISSSNQSLPVGLKISSELKTALQSHDLGLKFERTIDLGANKSAVYSVACYAKDKVGRLLSEPLILKPPVVVENYDAADFNSRRNSALVKALEEQVKLNPKTMVLYRTDAEPIALLIEKSNCPSLWKELSQGAKIHSELVAGTKGYSIHNIQIVSSDGMRSNNVGVYQEKFGLLAPILEFEAKRMSELRQNPQNEEQTRAKFIGSRGVVLSQKGLIVTSNTELGNYYCEALMFAPQYMAEYQKDCSILINSRNEPLNGFLHIPKDSECARTPVTLSPQQLLVRHEQNINVLSRAVVGYISQANEVNPDLSSIKFLIAGYTGFVANNPSGEFAVSAPVIQETLKNAFGPNLKTVQVKSSSDNSLNVVAEVNYQGRNLKLDVIGVKLPVDAKSIDYGEGSIQKLISQEKPQIVIGLGVNTTISENGRYYDAGSTCDNALILGNEKLRAAFNMRDSLKLPENNSLPGAIYSGDQILSVRNRSK